MPDAAPWGRRIPGVVVAALALALLAACFAERTDYRSGEVACSRADESCPSGLACAYDHRCYLAGHVPTAPDASTCVAEAPATTCGPRVCGTVRNNCGENVPCGPMAGGCPGTKMCDASGACVDDCTPLTACPAGDECGAVDPGCGQPQLTCGGACPSERPTCAANKCICVPLATCPSGVCSAYPNGCGGSLQCDCTQNQLCDTAMGQCRDKTQAEACAGLTCGSVASGSQTYLCGTCTPPERCSNDAGGTCACQPQDPCAGKNCGSFPDGCGTMVDCDPNHTCNVGLCYECDVGICTFRTQCT